ncbi:unnamed protein product [Angiostrongylus costaricensis]|uniref:ATP synthase mitochondrial F1 complex assembly factor 2 n=1 Tax=Angiostrongylus costaricensis TaxID=334426 RepID=A0A158PFX4_ANGCS|nr:unnamed protein product [Angiostrongylus costaricensis]
MRLTGLAFTALDNPLHIVTARILEYLHGDTVLFWNNESEKLERYQQQYWQPVIDHANKGLGTSFKPSKNLLDSDVVSSRDSRVVEKWLKSYNLWALIGMQYAVESLKSVLLPYSVVTFQMGAKEAIHCATLEQRTQAETWGSVEWAHEVEQEDLTSRIAAAALFVYFTSNNITKTTL